jgi:hypothetical protein
MNHLREEHRIQLSSPFTHQDSFTSLWEHIARRHHFLKLTFPPSHTPTKEELDEALLHQDGSLSPYSTRMFAEYEVIYQNPKKGTVLITNRPALPTLGTFFATEDADAPHRYFVAFAFRVAPSMESITGLLVYLDERGYGGPDRVILCRRVLATYDERNGLLRSSSLFLYHQTLLFAQTQRDTHKLMLYLSFLPYQTDIIQDHVYYYTNVVLATETSLSLSLDNSQRFLCAAKQDHTYFLLDMGSLAIHEESHFYRDDIQQTQRYMVMDSYTIYEKENLPSFLEVASLFPEKEYSDGYPLFCVRCYQKVVAATYSAKIHPYSATQCGLGSGYCSACHIRYSSSKQAWVCAEIRLDGSVCQGYLSEEDGALMECTTSHLHSADQTLLVLSDSTILKYPFRQKIRIQWIPSDEARECARTTTILDDCPLLQPRPRILSYVDNTLPPFKDSEEVI